MGREGTVMSERECESETEKKWVNVYDSERDGEVGCICVCVCMSMCVDAFQRGHNPRSRFWSLSHDEAKPREPFEKQTPGLLPDYRGTKVCREAGN